MTTVSGATYKTTRPRGFAPWDNATAESLAVIAAVRDVLAEYRDYLPMTVRQIFYRLVASGTIDKTERSYKALAEKLNRARRAGLISFGAIRDDGGVSRTVSSYADPDDLEAAIAGAIVNYRRDFSPGVELWVEAAGMVEMLTPTASAYRVPVFSSGGFDSVTSKHRAADRIAASDRPVRVLHIGDLDPSGLSIVDSAADDVGEFLAGMDRRGWVTFSRLAVTDDQAAEYQLPTAPPKKTDRRGDTMTDTVQVEAIAPDLLVSIVDTALSYAVDLEALAAHEDLEAAERAELAERFGFA
jgi:hypothetical protein